MLDEVLIPRRPCWNESNFRIASSNLDEFFEVRVAELKQQIESEIVERSLDGLIASETFRHEANPQNGGTTVCLLAGQLVPALAVNGRFLKCST